MTEILVIGVIEEVRLAEAEVEDLVTEEGVEVVGVGLADHVMIMVEMAAEAVEVVVVMTAGEVTIEEVGEEDEAWELGLTWNPGLTIGRAMDVATQTLDSDKNVIVVMLHDLAVVVVVVLVASVQCEVVDRAVVNDQHRTESVPL